MRDRVKSDLRELLRDVFAAKASGEAYTRLARAHGYVDGYMRAVLDLGVLDKNELLALVNAERERASGPALGNARDDEPRALSTP
jgi:hypothetical protein